MIVVAASAALLAGTLLWFRNDPVAGVAAGFVLVACTAAFLLDSLRLGRWVLMKFSIRDHGGLWLRRLIPR